MIDQQLTTQGQVLFQQLQLRIFTYGENTTDAKQSQELFVSC
jgi:hypothetical protein